MKKATTPEGTKLKRMLPFKLSDEEKARKGEIAAQLNKQHEEAVTQKKVAVAKHNERINDLSKRISVQLMMINEGVERREVQCTEVKNYESNEIQWWFNNEKMDSREMTTEERQMELTPVKKKSETSKEARPKWAKLAPKYKSKAEREDEEIASVHKLETSRRGASSMVDPKN